jgi:hypothetical protein
MIPEAARRYAIPAVPGVRRYGFHGWPHCYVTERYAELTRSPEPTIVPLPWAADIDRRVRARGLCHSDRRGASHRPGNSAVALAVALKVHISFIFPS